MSGVYHEPSGSQIDPFTKFGHPGRYTAVKTVQNTTVDFTSSNYGYGAVIVGESSAAGTITLSDGGDINIAHLTVGTIYELSPRKVVESGNKAVYILKRQQ
jgi:carbamoylphosphate synthase small subunit